MTWNPDIGIPIAVIGVLVVAAVILLGKPRRSEPGRRDLPRGRSPVRAEPRLDAGPSPTDPDVEADPPMTGPQAGESAHSQPYDRIVTLLVAARAGCVLRGPDLVVAAEKAGLVFGRHDIFHRLADGRPDQPAIFSVANLIQPGSFDLGQIAELETPGISLFMALPGPLPALDAWEALLPTAQRLAELLDAIVLDEDRNALSRQRIAHIRDELRAYDRKREDRRSRW
ncbi:MAG TPA: cell division protein ZipA [Xanthomonadales bacterium]|nr:cell division protein ZipA [Xanthomonadales bacterium]